MDIVGRYVHGLGYITWTLGIACVLGLAAPASAGASRSAARPVHKPSKPWSVCFDRVFSQALPGKVDYCLGMRDWTHGEYDSALDYFHLAAGWGNKSAQYTLGMIYYNGHHVQVDHALGLAWMRLADERDDDPEIGMAAAAMREFSTPAQRHRAVQLVRQMLPRYGDKVAAARAWRRLHNWRTRNGNNAGCVRLSGAQAAAARRLGLAGSAPSVIRPLFQRPVPSGSGPRARRMRAKIRAENSAQSAGVCMTFRVWRHTIQKSAAAYFKGYMGVVTVGPLKVVPSAAASSGH